MENPHHELIAGVCCPYCYSNSSSVKKTQALAGQTTARKRECNSCGKAFFSEERVNPSRRSVLESLFTMPRIDEKEIIRAVVRETIEVLTEYRIPAAGAKNEN